MSLHTQMRMMYKLYPINVKFYLTLNSVRIACKLHDKNQHKRPQTLQMPKRQMFIT